MKRLLILPVCAALCLGCAGCGSIYSSYREVEQLQLIQTIGIDIRDEGTTLSISSGQGGSSGSPGDSGGSGGSVSATTMSCTGSSLTGAMRSLQAFSTREDILYAHTQYAVLGEDTAVRGIGGVLDFISRAGQIRMNIGMFVLRGGTAEDLITRSAGPSSNITEILASLDRTASRDGTSHVFSCQDITRALAERGSALICAITPEETEGVIFSEAGELAAIPRGYGLLKGENLCGYITGETARGVNLLLAGGSLGSVEVDVGRRVSLDVSTDKCTIEPVWQGGELAAIEVNCRLGCAVSEQADGAPLSVREYEALTGALSSKIRGWLLDILELQRLHDADFLGLCDFIRASDPEKFAAVANDWPAPLRSVEYRVFVQTDIARDYDLHAPVN